MPLLEWEYTPPIGPRPMRGFVGLKNAGATCYMNSVIQQVCFHRLLLGLVLLNNWPPELLQTLYQKDGGKGY